MESPELQELKKQTKLMAYDRAAEGAASWFVIATIGGYVARGYFGLDAALPWWSVPLAAAAFALAIGAAYSKHLQK